MKPSFLRHILFNSSAGGGYSDEYQAILNAGLGTAPSDEVKKKDNTCINELKEAGIWDMLDVFHMFHTDGDAAFAYINWKNPAQFNLTAPVAPTFAANQGITGGSNSYLTSSYAYDAGVNFKRDAASFGYYKNSTGDSLADMSSDGGISASLIGGTIGGVNYYRLNGNGPNNDGGISVSPKGFKHFNRSGASADQTYVNGVLVDSSSTASIAVGSGNLTILRRASAYSTGQIWCAFVGGDLSAKAGDFYTIIAKRLGL